MRDVTNDTEVTAAAVALKDENPGDLPLMAAKPFAPEWEAEGPVLCIAGRSRLDESTALMLAQLLGKHGLSARVEGPEALSSSDTFPFETEGVVIVCLSYLDANSPAHMGYAIRRLRRRLPNVKVLLGCWMVDGDTENLRELVKADTVAATLWDAVKLCLEAAYDH